VTLLLGYYARVRPEGAVATRVETFTTTRDLGDRLSGLAGSEVGAVFHAAAVSDFRVARVWTEQADGARLEVRSAKIPTRLGKLMVEFEPAPKLIGRLRDWFPRAAIVGWKYELEGDRAAAVALGRAQIEGNRTDACVVNGRAYGEGFGLVAADGRCHDCATREDLFTALARFGPRE
jgi:phosphopantothenoylcysteine synthetase/decarboxylase